MTAKQLRKKIARDLRQNAELIKIAAEQIERKNPLIDPACKLQAAANNLTMTVYDIGRLGGLE